MISRADLLDAHSPAGVAVYQLTDDPALPSSHVYMEAQIFTPDSARLLLHRAALAHGSDPLEPRHRYQVCEVATGALTDLTYETGATAPSVSPDGCWVYYFVEAGGAITLKRVGLDGSRRETLRVLDGVLPGTRFRPSKLYSLSTIASDGARLAVSCFLGDGVREGAPFGLLVFDLRTTEVSLVLAGPTWCNMHPQYCRSRDAEAAHDLLVQENHGCRCDAAGEITMLVSGAGADIHVIRDDGMAFRNLPWGRDGLEFCQGHQCWIGDTTRALTSTFTEPTKACTLIAGAAAPFIDHQGRATPDAVRHDLSRHLADPRFFHFGTDAKGTKLVTDTFDEHGDTCLYLADLAGDTLANYRYLLNTRITGINGAHAHPFLSPDGKTAFFNSDEAGVLQAYMVRVG